MQYRKKPVIVDAMQYTGDNRDALIAWRDSFGEFGPETWVFVRRRSDNRFDAIIPTLEGDHRASPGDFIIRGVKGEFYPCKPDIFQMTYDRVPEEE